MRTVESREWKCVVLCCVAAWNFHNLPHMNPNSPENHPHKLISLNLQLLLLKHQIQLSLIPLPSYQFLFIAFSLSKGVSADISQPK